MSVLSSSTRGRGRHDRSRPRAGGRARAGLLLVTFSASLSGLAACAAPDDEAAAGADSAPATRAVDAAARPAPGGPELLGDALTPGQPTVQRLRHDGTAFTVTVAPSLPGPNLVRVDTTEVGGTGDAEGADRDRTDGHTGHADGHADGHAHDHAHDHGGEAERVMVGVLDAAGGPGTTRLVTARERPGADGLWAEVDLPADTATVVVSHGPEHRLPFTVSTGDDTGDDTGADQESVWTGPDGPECLAAATGTLLAGGQAGSGCPADELDQEQAGAVAATVRTLADRGLEELAVRSDGSPRSTQALDVVGATVDELAADGSPLRLVDETDTPGDRNALLVLSGWHDAASSLAATTALPAERAPVRSDGTWLAPWLLAPGIVDVTTGAVVPLDFDIRDGAAQQFSGALSRYLPGQAPTAAGYDAWRAARGEQPGTWQLYAASRAAYMPAETGHEAHETQVAWFPGGTVAPVGALLADGS